jgi:hypothetical protein
MRNCEQYSLPQFFGEESVMFEKYRKTSLPAVFCAGSILAALAPAGFATAGDSSSYLIGHWKLNDKFSDFKPPGSEIKTDNTEFVFLNPTNLTLTLEYAFFTTTDTTKPATFCGCDRDTLNPNGRVRYTMLGEKQGGQFSTKLCPTQTDGAMKTIVFTGVDSNGNPVIGDALQAGYQIDLFGGVGALRTEADLKAVAPNEATAAEINAIHKACVMFIKH